MSNNQLSIIESFYTAFKNLDAEGMVKHYHDDLEFKDPAFGKLNAEQAKDMWRMLCSSQKGKKFDLSFKAIKKSDKGASAYWEAKYIFSKTGREVHNKINASFEFEADKIVRHHDAFDLYAWSKQAIGPMGYIIGWTPFFRNKLQNQTHQLLLNYQNKEL